MKHKFEENIAVEKLVPMVSVVIPCYNAAAYIAETVNSVISQTYPAIEIIVVDDGSTDVSADVLQPYADAGSIILIRQKNAGVCNARNTGIETAKGDIIALLDADDWMYPDNIREKVDRLVDENADLVFSWAEVTDEKLTPKYVLQGARPEHFAEEVFNFTPPPIPSPSSVVARKAALKEVGMFDTQLGTSADLDIWIRLSFGHKIAKVGKPLVKYRLVPGSMNTNVSGQIKDMNFIFNKYSKNPGLKRKLKGLKKGFYYSILGNSYYTKNITRFFQYLWKFALTSI
jgi:glycosyltransferase involved in cell wall biosynthesis